MGHAPETRKVLRDLDKALARSGEASGESLTWTCQEQTVIDQIATVLDRKAQFLALYTDTDDVKTKLKISAELRLLEQSACRLITSVKTEMAEPPSIRSIKASRAAHVRWSKNA